jgi:hypothetical protein
MNSTTAPINPHIFAVIGESTAKTTTKVRSLAATESAA